MLDALAGDWDVTVRFPVGPGRTMEGTSSCHALRTKGLAAPVRHVGPAPVLTTAGRRDSAAAGAAPYVEEREGAAVHPGQAPNSATTGAWSLAPISR